MDARGNKPRDVGHVDHQERADAVGDRGHPLEVPEPRVGRRAGHDQLRTDLLRGGLESVVVDALRALLDAVRVDLVELPGEVHRRAMGEVAAVGEVHAQDPVARLEDAEVGGHVGLCARVGLDVDVLGAREERERPLDGQVLRHVHELAAAVVALPREALRVLVGEPRALRLEDRRVHVVLAGDQLDLVALAVTLPDHRVPQRGIDVGEPSPAEPCRRRVRHAWTSLPERGVRPFVGAIFPRSAARLTAGSARSRPRRWRRPGGSVAPRW
jgi:hypothetical protein